ncbi:MAG: SRPBCC family protein, partial [Vulcanimicrobiaceae bacterium]
PMTRSTTHAMFTIERLYRAVPERVFAAWSHKSAKAQWFVGGGEWQELQREDDFRVGGAERLVGRWPDGTFTDFRSRYEEIVPGKRIIFTCHMRSNDTPISVSLATVEFGPFDGGTTLTYTEQLTCLDGFEDIGGKGREHGTRSHLERLAIYLNEAPAVRH